MRGQARSGLALRFAGVEPLVFAGEVEAPVLLKVAVLSESMAASHDGRLKALVLDDIDTPPALRELLLHSPGSRSRPRRHDQ